MSDTGRRIAQLSAYIDAHHAARGFTRLEGTLLRLSKPAEEHGEQDEATRAVIGENPRKGPPTDDWGPVRRELLDTAAAALGAWEHLGGNQGTVMEEFARFIASRCSRAGLDPFGRNSAQPTPAAPANPV